MKTFSKIGSGARRSFQVSFGLRAGYGADAKEFTLEQAKAALHGWMHARAAAGQPFLTGQLMAGQVVYAWPDGPGKAGTGDEPGAMFVGEVSVLYDAAATDDEVVARLDELAAHLGNALEQTRVYAAYGDKTWVMEVEKGETPTGK